MDMTGWVNLQTKIPSELKTQLKAEAALADITQAELLVRALTAYFEANSRIPRVKNDSKE